MKRMYILLFAMAVAFQTGSLFANEGHDHDKAAEQGTLDETTKTKEYVCPMHPDVQSDKPGQCPKCGMTLKEAAHEEMSGEDSHEGHNHEHHQ